MAHGTFITLYPSLKQYDFVDPDPASVEIEDIAHSLSNMCRYAGHVPSFYSVAEHCVRVSRMLNTRGFNTEIQLKGLLHDASEAYCVDIPSPLKHQPEIEAGYLYHEERAQCMIARAFGLTMPLEHPLVKQADRDILYPEQDWRRGSQETHFGWSPAYAKMNYLMTFKELKEKL